MIAFPASATGNCMVNVWSLAVLAPPKSMTAIALLLLDELYINAPPAVSVPVIDQLTSAKSKNATVPLFSTTWLDSVAPPVVYPVPLTSLEFAVKLL